MKREQLFRYKKRPRQKNPWLFLALFLLVPALVSCGDGGSGILAGGGIGGTGNTSVGPITALGSIFVNGIEFQTTGASITVDGLATDEKELQVGMVVKVEGTVNDDGKTGKADIVIFNNNAVGPINRIDLDASTLEVMGQTVIVDTQTVIAGLPGNAPGLAGLAANDMVEISGLDDANGAIIATRITKTTGRPSEIIGRVGSLTTASFRINALTVDYSRATLSNFGPARIQTGDIVAVIGSLTSPSLLQATIVEKKSSDCRDNNGALFQGFIDSLQYTGQSVSGFTIITPVGLQRVELDASTIFSGGNPVKVGARVQVEGTVKSNIIHATKVGLLASFRMGGGNGGMMKPFPTAPGI